MKDPISLSISPTLNTLKKIPLTYWMAFLSFNTIIYQFLYYKKFKINIIDFFSINELIPLVFLIIPKVLMFLSLLGIIFVMIFDFLERINLDKVNLFKTLHSKIDTLPKKEIIILISIIYLFFNYLTEVVFEEYIFFESRNNWKLLLLTIFNVFICVTIYKVKIIRYEPYLKTGIFIYFVSYTIGFTANYEPEILKKYPIKDQVTFYYKNHNNQEYQIKTGINETYYYVGMSNEFIFLYNLKEEKSLILKLENIHSFEFFSEERDVKGAVVPNKGF